jgi:hypothetical protein
MGKMQSIPVVGERRIGPHYCTMGVVCEMEAIILRVHLLGICRIMTLCVR